MPATAELTHHVMHALGNRIWGFSPEMFDESQGEPGPSTETVPDPAQAAELAQRYPRIVQIAVAATERARADGSRGCEEEFEFEFGLDLLHDGAERLRRSGWSSVTATDA